MSYHSASRTRLESDGNHYPSGTHIKQYGGNYSQQHHANLNFEPQHNNQAFLQRGFDRNGYQQQQQNNYIHPQQRGQYYGGHIEGQGQYGGRLIQPFPIPEAYSRVDPSVEEIFKEQTAGIDFSKYEEIEVNVVPNTIPPADSFTSLEVDPHLGQNIKLCKYNKLTPVQKYGIPIVLSGADMIACAQTGSGKTAAYLIPAVNLMLRSEATGLSGRGACPSALVLAPTRELGIQIYDEARKFTYRTWLRCVVLYGGADPRQQKHEAARGAHIIVATPGRLTDFFSQGLVTFNGVKYLVLDEADRMLDMGFEPQIRRLVEGRDSDMPTSRDRQTLMYSATFPIEIRKLALSFLKRDHFFLQVGRVGSTTENITQLLLRVYGDEKKTKLLEILRSHGDCSALIFCEKKKEADFLERFLNRERFSVTSIHGDRVQKQREMALGMFKNGSCNILVATDVASRGLDIPDISVVIQYDLPKNIDSYVHRIGRTGRAGNKGTAIAFFNPEVDVIARDLIQVMVEAKQEVPEWLRDAVPAPPNKANPNKKMWAARGTSGGGRGVGRGGVGYSNNYRDGGGAPVSYGGGGGYGGDRGGTGYYDKKDNSKSYCGGYGMPEHNDNNNNYNNNYQGSNTGFNRPRTNWRGGQGGPQQSQSMGNNNYQR